MKKNVWLSVMLIVSSLKKYQQCSIAICFTWKVSFNSLTLNCKVNSWNHRIFIDNQFGIAVADCIPSFCDSYHPNASINQLLASNEVIYTVSGRIDKRINGNWTCRHGSKFKLAKVEVTVLKDELKLGDQIVKDEIKCRNKTTADDRNCTESLICYTLITFVAMIVVCAIINWMMESCCNGTAVSCRNKLFSLCEGKLTNIGVLQTSILIGIGLVFLFGIPVIVGFIEKGTCFIIAIPAMVVMGISIGVMTSIICIGRKIKKETDMNETVRNMRQEITPESSRRDTGSSENVHSTNNETVDSSSHDDNNDENELQTRASIHNKTDILVSRRGTKYVSFGTMNYFFVWEMVSENMHLLNEISCWKDNQRSKLQGVQESEFTFAGLQRINGTKNIYTYVYKYIYMCVYVFV